MRRLHQDMIGFPNFGKAKYVKDVTFKQSFRPSGSIKDGKQYFACTFNGKYRIFGLVLQFELSVLLNWISPGCSKHFSGSVADLENLKRMRPLHENELKKITDENYERALEYSLTSTREHGAWLWTKGTSVVLGFYETPHLLRSLLAKPSLLARESFNRNVSNDLNIVENFFGRLRGLFTLLFHKWKWSERYNNDLFKLCLAFTNLHSRDWEGAL